MLTWLVFLLAYLTIVKYNLTNEKGGRKDE